MSTPIQRELRERMGRIPETSKFFPEAVAKNPKIRYNTIYPNLMKVG